MKTICKLLALSGCAVLLLGTPIHVFAQQNPVGGFGAADPGAPPQPSPFSQALSSKRIKEFGVDGLPLGEVAKYLSEQFPDVNFVMAPELQSVPISVMRLRNVSLQDIFIAISVATKGRIQATPLNENLISFTQPPLGERGGKSKLCRAFSLSLYLAGRSEDDAAHALADAEEALNHCWAMLRDANQDPDFEAPRLSVHAPTKLLIAVGEPEQLMIIEGLVTELEKGVSQAARGGMPGPGFGYAPGAPFDSRGATPAPANPKAPTAPTAPGSSIPPSPKRPAPNK